MKLMIVYATTEGHTRTIAEFLEKEAEKKEITAGLFDATVKPPSPEEYDAVIVAASIHAGKYQTAIEHFVQEHHQSLNRMKSLFVSVSLTAAADEPESWKELKQQTEDFLLSTGWNPAHVEYTAGALLYTKYDYLKRFIMRMISKKAGGDTDTSKDHVYTDWEKLKSVLDRVI